MTLRWPFRRAETVNRRYAKVYFEANARAVVNSADYAASGSIIADNACGCLLDEIRRFASGERIVFGPIYRGKPPYLGVRPYASCTSDDGFVNFRLILYELGTNGTSWELSMFQTLAGGPTEQLDEWRAFVQNIRAILRDRIGADLMESTSS